MNEKHPEPEPSELFTIFAYTSKFVKKQVKRYNIAPVAGLKIKEIHDTKTVSCMYLLDYTNKEFRATRTEAIAKARTYFESINHPHKSVTLFAYTFRAGKFTEQPIFTQETI